MTPVRTPPFTPAPRRAEGRSGYSVVEIAEGASGGLSAVAVVAATFPGFLLTVPGLLLFVLPVVAVGVLAAAAALVVAGATIPVVVGAWVVRRAWRARLALRAPRLPAMPGRARPTARHPAL